VVSGTVDIKRAGSHLRAGSTLSASSRCVERALSLCFDGQLYWRADAFIADAAHRSCFASLGDLRERPAGSLRITATEHAATTVLWPVLRRLLADYPEINVEPSIDSSLTDIVTGRFDAGVRLGEAMAKGMVATRIGPAHGGRRLAGLSRHAAGPGDAAGPGLQQRRHDCVRG
jgi:DNA-binding transcriptional LysR family regulator